MMGGAGGVLSGVCDVASVSPAPWSGGLRMVGNRRGSGSCLSAACVREILQGQPMTAPFGCVDQIKVTSGRDALADEPRMHSCVRQAQVRREGRGGCPNLLELVHSAILRNMRSVSQYANRQADFAVCVTIIGANP